MGTRFDTTPAAVRWSEAMHAMALAMWLAALAGAGLAAAIAFPAMKSLQPSLPDFPGAVPDHWMIAGGHIGRPAFMIADRASLLAAALAVITLAIVTRLGRVHGAWLAVRWACVGIAASRGIGDVYKRQVHGRPSHREPDPGHLGRAGAWRNRNNRRLPDCPGALGGCGS
mgnify:CR=1 FL=1